MKGARLAPGAAGSVSGREKTDAEELALFTVTRDVELVGAKPCKLQPESSSGSQAFFASDL